MTTSEMLAELQNQIVSGKPLSDLWEQLRRLRDANTSASQVVKFLQDILSQNDDSAIEDRVMEVLDYVTGFCNVKYQIWNDES